MGRNRSKSMYNPATRAVQRDKIVDFKLSKTPIKKSSGRKRSDTMDAATFRQVNHVHTLRERKSPPQRYEPENFILKRRERRMSMAANMACAQSSAPSTAHKRSNNKANFNFDKLRDEFQKIVMISKMKENKHPKNECIEESRYVLGRFPDNINVISGEAEMLLMTYEREGGILYVKPKVKRSIRQVEDDFDLVSFIFYHV